MANIVRILDLQDGPEIWMAKLRSALNIFGISSGDAEWYIKNWPYRRSKYFNLEYVAAGIWISNGGDPKYALNKINQEYSDATRVNLASYIKRANGRVFISVSRRRIDSILQKYPIEVAEIMLGMQHSDIMRAESRAMPDLSVYPKFNLKIKSRRDNIERASRQLANLVKLGWFIPELQPRHLILSRENNLVFAGNAEVIPENDDLSDVDFLLYMKLAVYMATGGVFFSDEIELTDDRIEKILRVANIDREGSAMLDLDKFVDLHDIGSVKAELKFETPEWRSLDSSSNVSNKLYAIIESIPLMGNNCAIELENLESIVSRYTNLSVSWKEIEPGTVDVTGMVYFFPYSPLQGHTMKLSSESLSIHIDMEDCKGLALLCKGSSPIKMSTSYGGLLFRE